MSKIGNIINGWKNLIITDDLLEPLFKQRLETCQTCENNIFKVCQLCLCPIFAKTHSTLENCPDYPPRWKPIFYIDNQFEYVVKSELPENLQGYFDKEEIPLEDWLEFLKKGEE